jgi:EAL domain-containing protein (putative c-di-GMP-specific phosphodiesterase class I)
MNIRAVERCEVEAQLHHALERGEFLLHYQPKMDLQSTSVSGVEALLRWMHPQRGLLASAEFVPVAEECGLIVPIGRWVLCEACRQVKAWAEAGLQPITMAVNLSASELRASDFAANVRAALAETGIEPRYLEFELNESFLMQDAKSTTAVLQALKELGVGIALDDFGTGYSSLTYLKRFPINALKIDRSFMRDVLTDDEDAGIVTAVISMANSLHLRVIAEGVETPEQLAFLQAQHCGEAQGYLFGRPLAANEFAKLLAPRAFESRTAALIA